MSVVWLNVGVAVSVYALSTIAVVELRNGQRVVAAGAIVPALLALGHPVYDIQRMEVVIVAALMAEFLARSVTRKGLWPIVWHGVLLSGGGLALQGVSGLRMGTLIDAEQPLVLLGLLLPIGFLYFVADFGMVVLGRARARRLDLREEGRAAIPLGLVVVSVGGLLLLVMEELGWLAFVLVSIPLFATQHEFSRFGDARRTYEQTVRALGRLTEEGGYAPAGHHERVARMVFQVAQELGVRGEELRRLSLVALLHDVGAVSLPEARDVQEVDADVVIANGMRILRETEYLKEYADVLLGLRGASVDLNGAILRVANRWDEVCGEVDDPVGLIERECASAHEDRALWGLRRVVARTGSGGS